MLNEKRSRIEREEQGRQRLHEGCILLVVHKEKSALAIHSVPGWNPSWSFSLALRLWLCVEECRFNMGVPPCNIELAQPETAPMWLREHFSDPAVWEVSLCLDNFLAIWHHARLDCLFWRDKVLDHKLSPSCTGTVYG